MAPDLEALLAECGPYSEPSTYEQSGVHHGYRRFQLQGDHPFKLWCDDGWVSWIDPGGFVAPHRDAGPWYRRYQLPIRANGAMWYEWGYETAEKGVPFEVSHYKAHGVVNDTDDPRVHVVWDTSERLPYAAAPFKVYPVERSDRILALVQRLGG